MSNSFNIASPFFGSNIFTIKSIFSSFLSSPSFLDYGDPTYHRILSPATCHINCKNSDCQFSIVSLNVILKQSEISTC
ncbi:MAG TPA: hypothetical protein VHJ38_05295 [Nitrososphaeraceae archaeon]|nr:hypothetical protein [Nitrososphaeraceae archaeon]